MKSFFRDKLIAIVLLFIGIVFIAEASILLYVLGLFPSYVLQASPEVSQFAVLGWGYGVLKMLVGFLSLITGTALIFSK